MTDERRYELLKLFLRPTEEDDEKTEEELEELKDEIVTLSHDGYVNIDYKDGEIDTWHVTPDGEKFVNEHGK